MWATGTCKLGTKTIKKRTCNLVLWDLLYRSVHRNYYDALGLSPKASQADIKKAYYKLSLKHHPDMAQGETDTFREITTAYEVLGNLKLRKLYDRGILPGVEQVFEPEPPKATYPDFYTQKARRAPTTGRSQQYNYDEWSRAHYGKMMADNEERKNRRARDEHFRSVNAGNRGIEVMFLMICTAILFASFMSTEMFPDYDTPGHRHRQDHSKTSTNSKGS